MSDILETIKAAYEEGFDDGMQMHRSDFDECWNASNAKRIYDSMKAARESEGGEAVGVVTFDGTVAWFPDARVHAGMEVYTTLQPDKWIPCSERLPTEADADEFGKISILIHEESEAFMLPWQMAEDSMGLWTPTGLKRPSPPEQESE